MQKESKSKEVIDLECKQIISGFQISRWHPEGGNIATGKATQYPTYCVAR